MLKDIAVPLTGGSSDEHVLEVSLSLARYFDACLSPLQIVELPEPPYNAWAFIPDPGIKEFHDRFRAAAAKLADRVRARLEAEHNGHRDVRVVEALYTNAWKVAAREALYSDMVVVSLAGVGRVDERGQPREIASLLLQAGRPVLVVPEKASLVMPLTRAIIAWRPTREAARAVHDALPFLRTAKFVDILIYDGESDTSADEHMGALVGHLDHHGVRAKIHSQESSGIDIGSLILSHAKKTGADLIVAGGYGHSRLLEWILGGVTRELLATTSIPLLLSN
jgi:Universal stress protein UspA and related nucleotide-binding proteins